MRDRDTPYKNMLASGGIIGPPKPKNETSLGFLLALACFVFVIAMLAACITAPVWLDPI